MAWDDRDPGLQDFLARIGKHRLLQAHEEIALGRRVRSGDRAARETMVNHNLRLVLSIARKYRERGLPPADLIQEGILGLHTAVDKFDPERGIRFSTYATWWVIKAMQKGLQGPGSEMIRLPHDVRQRRARALALMAAHPEWDITDVAEEMEEDATLIATALAAAAVVTSIHENPEDDESRSEPVDHHAENPQDVENDETAGLAGALATLDPQARRIVELRFGVDCTALDYDQIARELGLSKHKVQTTLRDALAELRGMMEVEA